MQVISEALVKSEREREREKERNVHHIIIKRVFYHVRVHMKVVIKLS